MCENGKRGGITEKKGKGIEASRGGVAGVLEKTEIPPSKSKQYSGVNYGSIAEQGEKRSEKTVARRDRIAGQQKKGNTGGTFL